MKHLEVVAAIIEYQGKILCMQRNVGKYEYVSLKFEFPGGKVEAGETQPQALMRELREEMEMQVEIADSDFVMSTNHVYPDFEITMHCYFCHPENDVFVRKEHVAHVWCIPEELEKLDWAPADIPVMQKVKQILTEGTN